MAFDSLLKLLTVFMPNDLSFSSKYRIWFVAKFPNWRDRIRMFLPGLVAEDFSVEVLSANERRGRFVDRYTAGRNTASAGLCFVEKRKVHRGLFSRYKKDMETVLCRELEKVFDGDGFRFPHAVGEIKSWSCNSVLFVWVEGRHPNLPKSHLSIASAIARLESSSAIKIAAGEISAPGSDYFASPFWARRGLYRELAKNLRALRSRPSIGGTDCCGPELRECLVTLLRELRRLGAAVKGGKRCFSHLDFHSRNLLVTPVGLHLIDWGQGRTGRIGFDAGDFLYAIFARRSVEAFERITRNFLARYLLHSGLTHLDLAVRQSIKFIFLSKAFWFLLRPDVIANHMARNEISLWSQRLAYLNSVLRSDWPAQYLPADRAGVP